MNDAKVAFSVMFVMLGLILGTLFGTYIASKDHTALIVLVIPSMGFMISSISGFMEVFTSK